MESRAQHPGAVAWGPAEPQQNMGTPRGTPYPLGGELQAGDGGSILWAECRQELGCVGDPSCRPPYPSSWSTPA